MTNRDRDDTYYDSATGERKRRQKRTLPKPLLRLLVVLAAIIIVVVVIVVVARSALHSGEAADYQRYMTAVADILERSDTQVGAKLETLLTTPDDTNRTQIQTQLDEFVATSEQLELEAKDLKAPKDLVDQSIHQIFLLVMSFRQMGVAELKPALMNALEVQDTEVAAEQISHALYYLVNSDFLYDEVFVTKATDVLSSKQLAGVKVPSSEFVTDPDLASAKKVGDILARLKTTGNLQAVHGVAVGKVIVMPDEKEITAGGTFNLTSSDELVFMVTVENQGNMAEKNVPVVVTLQAPDSTDPQKVTVEIPELKAKTQTTIEVKGLNPTAYGEVALLKVKVGPVAGEKISANNSIEAHVIFKL